MTKVYPYMCESTPVTKVHPDRDLKKTVLKTHPAKAPLRGQSSESLLSYPTPCKED